MSDGSYGPLTSAWAALTDKAAELDKISIRSQFDADPNRPSGFNLEAAGLFLDFGRQRLDLVRTPERIGWVGHAGLECDDLLSPQSDGDGFL